MKAGRIVVTLNAAALAVAWAVTVGGAETVTAPTREELAPGIVRVGTISHPRITESSGLVASRKHPGVFWTHNDGGGPKRQVLYAIGREGKALAEFRVIGAKLEDWEDLAGDDAGRLYLGDVGNNDEKRAELAVYEVDEPDPDSGRTLVTVNRGWHLRFPKKPFDCEALFVWQGHGYLISKVANDKKAELYRFPLATRREPTVLERVGRLPIESPVTGADLSADGRRLGVVCKAGAFVFELAGDPSTAGQAPYRRARFREFQIEGCCFVPEGLLTTAESREIILFTEAAFAGGH